MLLQPLRKVGDATGVCHLVWALLLLQALYCMACILQQLICKQ